MFKGLRTISAISFFSCQKKMFSFFHPIGRFRSIYVWTNIIIKEKKNVGADFENQPLKVERKSKNHEKCWISRLWRLVKKIGSDDIFKHTKNTGKCILSKYIKSLEKTKLPRPLGELFLFWGRFWGKFRNENFKIFDLSHQTVKNHSWLFLIDQAC